MGMAGPKEMLTTCCAAAPADATTPRSSCAGARLVMASSGSTGRVTPAPANTSSRSTSRDTCTPLAPLRDAAVSASASMPGVQARVQLGAPPALAVAVVPLRLAAVLRRAVWPLKEHCRAAGGRPASAAHSTPGRERVMGMRRGEVPVEGKKAMEEDTKGGVSSAGGGRAPGCSSVTVVEERGAAVDQAAPPSLDTCSVQAAAGRADESVKCCCCCCAVSRQSSLDGEMKAAAREMLALVLLLVSLHTRLLLEVMVAVLVSVTKNFTLALLAGAPTTANRG